MTKQTTTSRTAQARSLLKQLQNLGLNLTLQSGKVMTYTDALDVLARMDGYEAHSHMQSVQPTQPAAPLAVSKQEADATAPEADIAPARSDVVLTSYIDDFLSEGGESAHYPKSDWQYEVDNGDTRLGYRDWLLAKLEQTSRDDILPHIHELGACAFIEVIELVNQTSFTKLSEPRVRVWDSKGAETHWDMEPNLFDRWGEINTYRPETKPGFIALAMLTPEKHQMLQDSMAEEMCFIGTRFGVPGIFAEFEMCTLETETDRGDRLDGLYPDAEILPALKKAMALSKAHEKFPGAEFALCDSEDYSPCERHCITAFVPLTVLESKENPQEFMEGVCKMLWDTFDSVTPALAA